MPLRAMGTFHFLGLFIRISHVDRNRFSLSLECCLVPLDLYHIKLVKMDVLIPIFPVDFRNGRLVERVLTNAVFLEFF